MISSMTAFARDASNGEWGALVWELKSVNHRYLDLQFKLPDSLRSLEMPLREISKRFIARGKVECVLKLTALATAPQLQLNQGLLQEVAKIGQSVCQALNLSAPHFNPLEIMRWPEMVFAAEPDSNQLNEPVLQSFEKALQALVLMRHREGDQLTQFITQRLDNLSENLVMIKTRAPEVIKHYQQKISDRLKLISNEYDENRVQQEIAIIAQKLDISEEIDRSLAHIQEVQLALTNNEAVGRRLDFLMQELHREANTLANKANDQDISRVIVDNKVLIDQMREQVQNIE